MMTIPQPTLRSRLARHQLQSTPICCCACRTPKRLTTCHSRSVDAPREHNSNRRVVVGAGGLLAAAAAVGTGVLAVTAMAASAATGGGVGAAVNPQALVRSGMAKFRKNDVAGSVADFDAAYAADAKLRPYLWQRGLSLYYAGDYAEGARQFRMDVAVNPNDTEEAIWAFLCEARLLGPAAAREQFLKVGRDPRPVMRAAHDCFATGSPPSSILAAAGPDTQGSAAFYANLYVGLWHEAEGDSGAAREAVLASVATQYARVSGDYMADLARVHVQQRGWGGGGA